MELTKELYHSILGFIKGTREDTILDGVMIDGKNRKESVVEWHEEYTDLRCRVDNLREELIESGGIIPAGDDLFKHLIFGQNGSDNWVSGVNRQFSKTHLSWDVFESFKQNNEFLNSLTEFIKDPSCKNFIIFARKWKDAGGGWKWLYINRVAGACTDKVSSTASTEKFTVVFNLFHEHKLIEPYSGTKLMGNLKDGEWYKQNIHLMAKLHEIFKDELKSKKTDPILLSIFVWEIYKLKTNFPQKLEPFGI